MRAVVQRVSRASVTVRDELGDEVVGAIGPGLLVLLGVAPGDTEQDGRWLAAKLASLRIFPDEQDKMNLSLLESGGEALVVSQFTLYGDARKGRRPSFVGAAAPALAEPLYERFCESLAAEGVRHVARGRFGASMEVLLVNDGPVTLILDTPGEPS
jgi:D-tyrosyl-tRNA(Tyr) deacylase